MYAFRVAFLLLAAFIACGQCRIQYDKQYDCQFEDVNQCAWDWNVTASTGFKLYSGDEALAYLKKKRMNELREYDDGDGHIYGHFLMAELIRGTGDIHVWTPLLADSLERCTIVVDIKMINMSTGWMRLVVDTVSKTAWVLEERRGNDWNQWSRYRFFLGKIPQTFRAYIEFAPSKFVNSRVYVDNLQLSRCFAVAPVKKKCTANMFKCTPEGANYKDYCFGKDQVCDIIADCLNGADEMHNCEKVPRLARCTFETGWCGWRTLPKTEFNWNISAARGYNKRYYGPAIDHTFLNESGHFLYANLTDFGELKLGSTTELYSTIFNPPPEPHRNKSSPFYKSCQLRFFYLQFGIFSGTITVVLYELRPEGEVSMNLWLAHGSSHREDEWVRAVINIPTNVTNQYYLVLEARRGFRTHGDISIDDLSLSPECFGVNIPKSELKGYNYYDFNRYRPKRPPPPPVNKELRNKPRYKFTTCGAQGRYGPNQKNCSLAYRGTSVRAVTVLKADKFKGVQRWRVPETGFYTLIVNGAGGGVGYDGYGESRGASITAVVKLRQNQLLHFMIGQKGEDSCIKNYALYDGIGCDPPPKIGAKDPYEYLDEMHIIDDGGGGGGATMVFTVEPDGRKVPLIIAAGGGGLGGATYFVDTGQHGQGLPTEDLAAESGHDSGNNSAGAGGGWRTSKKRPFRESTGTSLQDGGIGGAPCVGSDGWFGFGGFGGGGGGCQTGGGGGGFVGGSASYIWRNAEGGWSYIAPYLTNQLIIPGGNPGDGYVELIPAFKSCGCSFLCAAADQYRANTTCICDIGFTLDDDGINCYVKVTKHSDAADQWWIIFAIFGALCLCFIPIFLARTRLGVFIMRYFYRRRRNLVRYRDIRAVHMPVGCFTICRNEMMSAIDPEFASYYALCDHNIRQLRDVGRSNLRIINFENPRLPIGHGAFAQVFQAFYRRGAEDTVELPVAVKTLPVISSEQNEADFVMEAVLMNHFRHRNIVHMLGVCFEQKPRLIVLELLAGGDLRTFLRRNRPTAERPTTLEMKDLMLIARDICKGLEYLHSKHFIHRDLAARNCLLTTNGPGRICKIADFGLARDIYSVSERADYIRKQGTPLPVKWMPPESFREGKFTYKCDIWAFGVLLWEMMTFGSAPYGQLTNVETMEYVLQGGRLSRPDHCPRRLYDIMKSCWKTMFERRPSAFKLQEIFTAILRDSVVMCSPLLPSPTYSNDDQTPNVDEDIVRPGPNRVLRVLSLFLPFLRRRLREDESGPFPWTDAPKNSENISLATPVLPQRRPSDDEGQADRSSIGSQPTYPSMTPEGSPEPSVAIEMPEPTDPSMMPQVPQEMYPPGMFQVPQEMYPPGMFQVPQEMYPPGMFQVPQEMYESGTFEVPQEMYESGLFEVLQEMYASGMFEMPQEIYESGMFEVMQEMYQPGMLEAPEPRPQNRHLSVVPEVHQPADPNLMPKVPEAIQPGVPEPAQPTISSEVPEAIQPGIPEPAQPTISSEVPEAIQPGVPEPAQPTISSEVPEAIQPGVPEQALPAQPSMKIEEPQMKSETVRVELSQVSKELMTIELPKTKSKTVRIEVPNVPTTDSLGRTSYHPVAIDVAQPSSNFVTIEVPRAWLEAILQQSLQTFERSVHQLSQQEIQYSVHQVSEQGIEPPVYEITPQGIQSSVHQVTLQEIQPSVHRVIPQQSRQTYRGVSPQRMVGSPFSAVPQEIQPSVHQAVPQEIQPSVHQAVPHEIQPSVHQAVPHEIQPSVHQAVPQEIQPSVHQSMRRQIYRSVQQPLPRATSPSFHQAVSQFMYSVRQGMPRATSPSVHQAMSQFMYSVRQGMPRATSPSVHQAMSQFMYSVRQGMPRATSPSIHQAMSQFMCSVRQPMPRAASPSVHQAGPQVMHSSVRQPMPATTSPSVQPGASQVIYSTIQHPVREPGSQPTVAQAVPGSTHGSKHHHKKEGKKHSKHESRPEPVHSSRHKRRAEEPEGTEETSEHSKSRRKSRTAQPTLRRQGAIEVADEDATSIPTGQPDPAIPSTSSAGRQQETSFVRPSRSSRSRVNRRDGQRDFNAVTFKLSPTHGISSLMEPANERPIFTREDQFARDKMDVEELNRIVCEEIAQRRPVPGDIGYELANFSTDSELRAKLNITAFSEPTEEESEEEESSNGWSVSNLFRLPWRDSKDKKEKEEMKKKEKELKKEKEEMKKKEKKERKKREQEEKKEKEEKKKREKEEKKQKKKEKKEKKEEIEMTDIEAMRETEVKELELEEQEIHEREIEEVRDPEVTEIVEIIHERKDRRRVRKEERKEEIEMKELKRRKEMEVEEGKEEESSTSPEEVPRSLEPHVIVHEGSRTVDRGLSYNPINPMEPTQVVFEKVKIPPKSRPGSAVRISERLSDVQEEAEEEGGEEVIQEVKQQSEEEAEEEV